jgi:hypothetical protein
MDAKQTASSLRAWYRDPKRLAIAAGIMVAVFMLGYVPSCIDARSVRDQNAKLHLQLELSELRGRLGMISYEANRNNYGSASQLSTDFFDGLRSALDKTTDARMKDKLRAVLDRRDQITTDLAQVNPVVKEKLADMYAAFSQAISELKN